MCSVSSFGCQHMDVSICQLLKQLFKKKYFSTLSNPMGSMMVELGTLESRWVSFVSFGVKLIDDL